MSTKLILNGFSINPPTHLPHLLGIVKGLTGYNEKHKCDWTSDGPIHRNYLGKMISEPVGIKITDASSAGSIVQGILENGYFTLRIWDSVYPAKIQFDLFLENDLPNIDLIIDHLSAPAIPQDGLGLFDYAYSINNTKEHTSPLQKDNISKDSSYKVNDLIVVDIDSKWGVTLNELKTIECYFCNNMPEHWISINKNIKGSHTNYISVLSCLKHKGLGKTREDEYSNTVDQYYSDGSSPIYVVEEIKDKNNKTIFTKNVIK